MLNKTLHFKMLNYYTEDFFRDLQCNEIKLKNENWKYLTS